MLLRSAVGVICKCDLVAGEPFPRLQHREQTVWEASEAQQGT